MHTEKCPVCDGSGRACEYYGPGEAPPGDPSTKPCHSCGGSGWLRLGEPILQVPSYLPGYLRKMCSLDGPSDTAKN